MTGSPWWDVVWPLAIAVLGGAAVGLERQASGHADGPAARFAGLRTFTLLGLLGGVAGLLMRQDQPYAAAALLVAAGGLVVAAYVAASGRDVDGTTEAAALIVLAAGTLAGIGRTALAGGIVAFSAVLLAEKSRLHALAARVDSLDLRAGLRFAAMALVILPVLPAGPFGPGIGIRPRELWALVLFFSGLSFAGHLARRALGPGQGLIAAGALGGLVSSTNVTLTFARNSRDGRDAAALAAGVVAANAVLFPRVLLATVVLNPSLAIVLAPRLSPAIVVAALAVLWALRAPGGGEGTTVTTDNPLKVAAALQMAALFQIVLYGVHAAREAFGALGVLASGAVLGLTDVDALTVTMARGAVMPDLAARAIVVGVLSNTVLKLALALGLGGAAFRAAAGGALAVLALAVGAGLLW
ncbi:MAG: MgtC/SapB family protein [Vicinamibacterales bacterium]